jgi:hypothetical protein
MRYDWRSEEDVQTKQEAIELACKNTASYLVDLPAPHELAMKFPNMLHYGPKANKNILKYDRYNCMCG